MVYTSKLLHNKLVKELYYVVTLLAQPLLKHQFLFFDGNPANTCITFVQRRPKIFDVGPTLYKCYTNVLCLPGVYHVYWELS